mmetsp:Transcript_10457/g.26351  ORF Transcript_10457/g.26351 Transcript_10457/m.26351 type:complete len:1418 (-) Transcript_10457:134-4387(-)
MNTNFGDRTFVPLGVQQGEQQQQQPGVSETFQRMPISFHQESHALPGNTTASYANSSNNHPNDHPNQAFDFFTPVETNSAQITQRERSFSAGSLGSFGSFSMDGDDHELNFGEVNDATTTTTTTTTTPVAEIVVSHPKETPNNTADFNQLANSNYNDRGPQQQQYVPTIKEDTTSHSIPPSTTTTTTTTGQPTHVNGGGHVSNGNHDKLQHYETKLRALGAATQGNGETVHVATAQTSAEPLATTSAQPPIHPQQQQQQKQKGPRDQVIELIDDDDAGTKSSSKTSAVPSSTTSGVKRPRPNGIVPGATLYQNGRHNNGSYRAAPGQFVNPLLMRQQRKSSNEPRFFTLPPGFTPTWGQPIPPPPTPPQRGHSNSGYKSFELSLLNLSEFTITGLPVTYDGTPSSCLGFRKVIKKVSETHGKPVFENDNPKQRNGAPATNSGEHYNSYGENEKNPDGGKWRIPLGAYRAFYSYLVGLPNCKVQGIPNHQLQIASMGKARLDKGFPSARKIISFGVPRGLATTLAPFQRGGVDFVVERNGRALIADDMGLGKTIQSIASMSIYHEEWPLLILTPSSARYHWAAEFNNWLGAESNVNNPSKVPNDSSIIGEKPDENEEDLDDILPPLNPMRLLRDSEIHVMTAGREKVFPTSETRIVICSYGLATSLVDSGKLFEGLFRCAIVDESHMLKNIKTKRTSKLVPILHATSRCILLSGTPALARPSELWPQLKILSTERDGWWDDEDAFVRKYVQRTSAIRRAELHTMLTGTVMIRRMKHDILKSLPNKQRQKAIVDVLAPEMRREFHTCMKLLREGKGVMAKIAKKHSALAVKEEEKEMKPVDDKQQKLQALQEQYHDTCRQKLQSIRFAVQSMLVSDVEKETLVTTHFTNAKKEIDVWYKERVHEMKQSPPPKQEEELDRKTILNKMYCMTAKAKIPFIAGLVSKWLDDPTKGKLCIFAHHISVLDEIVNRVGLSNDHGSRKRFIRIDGSTNPKERQAQIVAFQNDPDIRIAVLGITAAGVAVTLTASSTVWFTELFWTPALMIQAEDRCHRIGQNAVVKCLYFVASGTLDVLLWDLLEKKFRDLGEFVEGREKMKIVVHHTYKSVTEVESMFIHTDDDDPDDDANENDADAEGNDLIKLEDDLQDDIVQLAQEEMGMIAAQGEDEDGERGVAKQASAEQPSQPQSTQGQTEDEAILLSDDEEEEATVVKTESKDNSSGSAEQGFDISTKRVLTNFRLYKQVFHGPSYGIQLLMIGNRIVVSNNAKGTQRPTLGDVLVAVNGSRVEYRCGMEIVIRFMKRAIQLGAVELTFLEDQDFVKHYASAIAEGVENMSKPKKPKSEDVIEIIDDDDNDNDDDDYVDDGNNCDIEYEKSDYDTESESEDDTEDDDYVDDEDSEDVDFDYDDENDDENHGNKNNETE